MGIFHVFWIVQMVRNWAKHHICTLCAFKSCINFIFKFLTHRNFFILNPTDTTYNFVWTQESLNGVTHGSICSNFTCLTPKGSINPGKKTEIGFEYEVESLELTESFWRFTIVDQNVSVPFLLVAHGNEPNISFDRSHINFKQLLIGKNFVIVYVWQEKTP